jgi:hypothetical protein
VTAFGYLPITRADTPSRLRQLSYMDNSPVVGPEGDPEGWTVHAPIKVTGTLFGTRQVEVDLCVRHCTSMAFHPTPD